MDTSDLPAVIHDYLAAHARRDASGALRAFTPDAVVTDDGHAYSGTAELRRFLSGAGAEYSFTTSLIGADHISDDGWVAVNHLEGDFPGGVVDLRYRFTLRGDLIAALTIVPWVKGSA